MENKIRKSNENTVVDKFVQSNNATIGRINKIEILIDYAFLAPHQY